MSPLRRQDGISLVPAVFCLTMLLVVAAIAMQDSVNALVHSSKQYRSKRALQAADAALSAAVYSLNRADLGGTLQIDALDPGTILNQNCIVSTGEVGGEIDLAQLSITAPTDPDGRRWCPVVEETVTDDNGEETTWQFRVSELVRLGSDSCGDDQTLSLDREVVAVGRRSDATRRVRARIQAAISLLSGAAVQSGSSSGDLTMSGTARILGTAHSNRNITGAATNTIGGNAIAGPTGSVSGPIVAGTSAAACHRFVLPAVDVGTALEDSDDGAWTSTCHNSLTGLSISCKPLLTTTGGVTWTSSTRTLEIWGNGRAVLTGDNYVFCHLRIRDTGQLIVPNSSAQVRIFLADPESEECDGVSGAGQINMDGQGRIINCHLQTQPQTLQLYGVGNAGTGTTQTLAGGGLLSGTLTATLCGLNLPLVGVPMTVYAPRSHVQIGGSTAVAGQVAGQTVEMSGTAAVQPINALINLNQLGANPVLPLYRQVEYIECSPLRFDELAEGDPSQGC